MIIRIAITGTEWSIVRVLLVIVAFTYAIEGVLRLVSFIAKRRLANTRRSK